MPEPPIVELRRFQHPTVDLRLDLPDVLEVRADVRGVALLAVAPGDPGHPDGFRANLNLVIEQPRERLTDLDAYQRSGWAANEAQLNRLDLWDQEHGDLAGVPCVRSLGHYLRGDRALVMEQWRFVRSGRGWTVTTTMVSPQVGRLRPFFVAAVESLDLGRDA